MIARWNVVDAYAEHPDQIDLSPYAYVGNNPINKTDPDGNCPCLLQIWEEVGAAAVYEALFASTAVVGTVAIIAHAHNSGGVPIMEQDATRTQSAVPERPAIIKTESDKQRGSNNQKTKDAAKTGQEAHRQEEKKLEEKGAKTEQTMPLKDGTVVRKDAVMPDGTAIIIKPNTPSGKKSAEKREQKMKNNGVPTQTIFYDPLNPAYQPSSPSYIGPMKKSN